MFTTILPGDGIFIVAVTPSELPVFFTAATRPEFVPETVKAIFPAHLQNGHGYYHHCIVAFGSELGSLFSRIAASHAAQVEQEAHELARLEEVPDYATAMQ